MSWKSIYKIVINLVLLQINGVNLTEIQGGEVATTNLHSCNDPEFVLQIQMSYDQDHGIYMNYNSI